MQLSPEMLRQARNWLNTASIIALMWLSTPMAHDVLSPGWIDFLGKAVGVLFGSQALKRLGDKSHSEHELEVMTVANNVAASLMPPAPTGRVIVPPPLGNVPQELRVTPYDVSDLHHGGKTRS